MPSRTFSARVLLFRIHEATSESGTASGHLASSRSDWPFKASVARLADVEGAEPSRCLHPHHGLRTAAGGAAEQPSSQRAFSSRSGDGRPAQAEAPVEAGRAGESRLTPSCPPGPLHAFSQRQIQLCVKGGFEPGRRRRRRHHDNEPGLLCESVGAAGAQPVGPGLHAAALHRYVGPLPSRPSAALVQGAPEPEPTLLVHLPAARVPLNRVPREPLTPPSPVIVLQPGDEKQRLSPGQDRRQDAGDNRTLEDRKGQDRTLVKPLVNSSALDITYCCLLVFLDKMIYLIVTSELVISDT